MRWSEWPGDWCTRRDLFQICVAWSKAEGNETSRTPRLSHEPCKRPDDDVRPGWLFQPFRSEVRRPEQKVSPIYPSLESDIGRELIDAVQDDFTVIRMTLSEDESNMVLAHIFGTDREWYRYLNSHVGVEKQVEAECITRKVSLHFGLSVLIQTIDRCERSVVQFTPTFSKP